MKIKIKNSFSFLNICLMNEKKKNKKKLLNKWKINFLTLKGKDSRYQSIEFNTKLNKLFQISFSCDSQ